MIPGFISLDCGRAEGSSYIEKTTTINYISDAAFIKSGVIQSIMPKYRAGFQQQATFLRSFPEGIRNCYTLTIKKGTKYFFRTSFLYGNYDGLNKNTIKFDLHIGPNYWDTVTITSDSVFVFKEMIYTPPQDYVHVCLVNTGSGTPFIQAIELRPLKNNTYMIYDSGALSHYAAVDTGSTTNSTYRCLWLCVLIRYPYDALDRFWSPQNDEALTQLTTSLTVDSDGHKNDYWLPPIVMNNAAVPIDKDGSLRFNVSSSDKNIGYYVYLHFAELQLIKPNESRAFNFYVNGKLMYGPIVPKYLTTLTIHALTPLTGQSQYNFSLTKLQNSTLPPILNAIEIYSSLDFSQSETHQDDVEAIMGIKSTYDVKKNWDGDPCVPLKYLWAGLNCSNDILKPPRIRSLDLSSSGLSGSISEHISKLTMLESLDLSDNNLTGFVPDFLSSLPNLRVLNLKRNMLTGSVPASLLEKSKNGLLLVKYAIFLCLNMLSFLEEQFFRPITNFISLVLSENLASSNFQTDSLIDHESKKRQFTYSEVTKMTNNFEKVLGKGGFGYVFHGIINDDGTQVAVKMLSQLSNHGYQQFLAEVKVLMRVHHRNLTSLVGYCNEESNKALIYEYIANGSLDSHLSQGVGNNKDILSWEERLQIAIDAAQGLEYLHNGCKPPIVHRDVKTSNILITDNFHAKIADFGLSRIFPADNGTHISTVVAGTVGYFDPE
ncbi:LRR receptor-like serine/threonine-protein kinase IOS1 [Cannabis sativa]|uniref:LRR receptor-like serine/threonine-protein kinase IOS1 n=1 Tax=Cannabis sativa TaxID=3483 RepID=UPI0029C9F8BF|nr:LRR receptor-like serine/threonine-protein kinase IOS1 [Cannabis sativa]